MNYEQACQLLTPRAPYKKKVARDTWAHRKPCEEQPSGEDPKGQDRITVNFGSFQPTELLCWFPDGSVRVRLSYGTKLIRDRIGQFIGSGSVWSMGDDAHILLHPRGSSPLSNDATFDADWRRLDLGPLNDLDAYRIYSQVSDYAVEYSKQLTYRRLVDAKDCEKCKDLLEQHWAVDKGEGHLLSHIQSKEFPPSFMRVALQGSFYGYASTYELAAVLPQCLSRKPPRKKHTEEEMLVHAESMILDGRPPKPAPHPHDFRKAFRIQMKGFLLKNLGFT